MTDRQVFVARERELDQLGAFLQSALAGRGQVCFLTGEPGSGKTTLVTEFARQAQEQHGDLVVAIGQSDAQTGAGDPYLPFREVLGQLTGDVEGELARGAITPENANRLRKALHLSVEALLEVGPDLIGIFVPGVGLATRVAAFAAEKVGWLDKLEKLTGRPREDAVPGDTGIQQNQIFEQYTNVLKALAAEQPLMLLLDDLQWADSASAELLFRLGRRIGESRILIVGTYRPDEVALGRAGERHPLEKVLAEFKRYFGDIWVNLDRTEETEGRQFVEAYLATEPNQFGVEFRQALYQITSGHPLFTVELLRHMQERGDVVRDEQGQWVEGPVLDWSALPARVEGVIEERIGRLEGELREVLTVASVEGEDFTAEVVAQVKATEARGLVRRLSGELEKRHRLVNAQGVRRVGTQRLSLYRFRHNLFQRYLYSELGDAERAYLHEDVGNVLEALYGDQADEISVPLARHFVEAGIAEKAAYYLRRAGEQAAERFANAEALAYFDRALDLTPEDGLAERYTLLLAREAVYNLQGEREAQRQDLAALEGLAEALTDDRRQARVALRQAHYAEATGDYAASSEAAQTATRLAQTAQDVQGEAAGYWRWGIALSRQGDYEEARTQLEQALALAREAALPRVEGDSLRDLGTIYWFQGDYAGARPYYEQALTIFREIGDRQGETWSLTSLGIITAEQNNIAGARVYFEQALRLFREVGHRRGESATLNNLGAVSEKQGDYAGARVYFEQSLGIRRQTGDCRGEALVLQNLGDVCARQGDHAEAQRLYQQALRIFRQLDDRQGEGWVLTGLSLLSHCLDDDEAAREHSQLALLISRDLGDRSTQSVSLTNLGHALAGLGHLEEAADAYQQALALHRELGEHNRAMEPLAGLACVSLAQGDLTQALALVEEILRHLETGTLDGADEPFQIYLTCYRVLRASGDPRAHEILDTAHRLLQERAVKMPDAETRRMFVENVAAHREIVSEFAKGEQGGTL